MDDATRRPPEATAAAVAGIVLPTPDAADPQRVLKELMRAMDAALDAHDLAALRRVIDQAPAYEAILQTDHQRRHFIYALSNAWNEIYAHERRGVPDGWAWDHPAYDQWLLHLRRAIDPDPKTPDELGTAAQVFVNLGNALAAAGRYVEAIEMRDRVLSKIEPKHSMAHGNNGQTLKLYAQHIHDAGHQRILAIRARDHLRMAIAYPDYLYPAAHRHFELELQGLEKLLGPKANGPPPPTKKQPAKRTEEEEYRYWAARERLFLNPLNDVYLDERAAYDPLHLPNMIVDDEIGTGYQGLFNQMKEEFVTARLLLFEGLQDGDVHFADKGVTLINTLDYPKYTVRVEKVKIAFRLAYSLLDKIAFFLNRYFALGVPDKHVAFRTIWFSDRQGKKLRPEFATKRNLPLRGLYWMSKDLYDTHIKGSTEPDARELAELRNHIEHKYLKVHEWEWTPIPYGPTGKGPFEDWIAHHISDRELENRTLRMLKKARAAMTYLIMSIIVEEHERHDKDDRLVVSFQTDKYDDDWKR